MAFKLPKNVVSRNNMKNVLYLVSLALAVGYVMNRQNIALVSLLVVAGAVYMLKKDVVLALGVSIVVTNVSVQLFASSAMTLYVPPPTFDKSSSVEPSFHW